MNLNVNKVSRLLFVWGWPTFFLFLFIFLIVYSLFFRLIFISKFTKDSVIYFPKTDAVINEPVFSSGRWLMDNVANDIFLNKVIWNIIYYSASPLIVLEKAHDTKKFISGSKEYSVIHHRIELLHPIDNYDFIFFSNIDHGYGAVWKGGVIVRKWEESDGI